MTITNVNTETQDEDKEGELQILSTLLKECSDEHTKKTTIYYITCQSYLKEQVCGIDSFSKTQLTCELTLTELKCGSLKTKYNLVLGVQGSDPYRISQGGAGKVIENEIKDSKLGAFGVEEASFNSTSRKTSKPDPTKEPPQAEPNVYVILTLDYTWREFCTRGVNQHLKERIAERSYSIKGEQLKPADIYIVNKERNCKNPDDESKGIDVWLAAIGEDQDKVTIQIGKDLKDLLDSRQTRKLGNLFEDKVQSNFKLFWEL